MEAPPERVTFPVFRYIEGKGFYKWRYMKGVSRLPYLDSRENMNETETRKTLLVMLGVLP